MYGWRECGTGGGGSVVRGCREDLEGSSLCRERPSEQKGGRHGSSCRFRKVLMLFPPKMGRRRACKVVEPGTSGSPVRHAAIAAAVGLRQLQGPPPPRRRLQGGLLANGHRQAARPPHAKPRQPAMMFASTSARRCFYRDVGSAAGIRVPTTHFGAADPTSGRLRDARWRIWRRRGSVTSSPGAAPRTRAPPLAPSPYAMPSGGGSPGSRCSRLGP